MSQINVLFIRMKLFLTLLQRVVVNGIKSNWAPVLSGVPKGTVLGPVLFSMYINDITTDTDSEIWLFADDCVCYREIKRYRRHCKTSGGYRLSWLFGKEMGHEIPTCQMQYHADYKETDQKDQCFL